jgi:DNA-binding transcriptional ArsR family regulator
VELQGQLLVRMTRVAREPDALGDRGERTELQVEGQASSVRVGGLALAPALLPEAASAAPVLGLAAVALAWLSGAGPKVLAMAISPAFAGVAPRVLLENDRRRQIYQAVLLQPGTHMRELQRVTGLRWGSLQYHVAVLVSMGLLRSAQSGRRTVLACDVHGLAPEQIRALHLLRGSRARRVADVVARASSVTQRDVVDHAGVSPRLASRYLGMMGDLGLVDTLAGRPKRYIATSRMAELLPRAGGAPTMPPAV